MTKALQLARLFARAGHKVVLIETQKYWASGHAYSNCVDKFYTLPNPREGSEAYFSGLESIVAKEAIDRYVPVASPTSVYLDAKWKSRGEEVYHELIFDEATLDIIDNKFQLCKKAREIGLSAPDVTLITDIKDFDAVNFSSSEKKYVLKSLTYNPLERLRRPLLPFKEQNEYLSQLDISHERAWVLQEFVEGQEFCTHSTVRNGEVLLHCCCPSSDFQLRYKNIIHQDIYRWVTKFVAALKLTGQISFDFIVRSDGRVMPIECNPRTHSAVTSFYNSDRLPLAYLGDSNLGAICSPDPEAKETYWFYHELWQLFTASTVLKLREQLHILFSGKEAILDGEDPLPFLMVYHWHIPALLLQSFLSGKRWIRIDFNIGKLVEAGGD